MHFFTSALLDATSMSTFLNVTNRISNNATHDDIVKTLGTPERLHSFIEALGIHQSLRDAYRKTRDKVKKYKPLVSPENEFLSPQTSIHGDGYYAGGVSSTCLLKNEQGISQERRNYVIADQEQNMTLREEYGSKVHKFTVEWRPDTLKIYHDDNLVFDLLSQHQEADEKTPTDLSKLIPCAPMRLVAELQIGSPKHDSRFPANVKEQFKKIDDSRGSFSPLYASDEKVRVDAREFSWYTRELLQDMKDTKERGEVFDDSSGSRSRRSLSDQHVSMTMPFGLLMHKGDLPLRAKADTDLNILRVEYTPYNPDDEINSKTTKEHSKGAPHSCSGFYHLPSSLVPDQKPSSHPTKQIPSIKLPPQLLLYR